MHLRILALILALLGLGLSAAFAGEKAAVTLYLAQNNPPAATAILAPEALHDRLQTVFGFKHYRVVKTQEIELSHHWEQWAVPRKDFFLRVQPLAHKPGEPEEVAWEVYKDGFIVAKGKYELHGDTPLFINGPDYKSGRFIFVVEAK